MPINIPCEYECDQCATKVAGVTASLPAGWVELQDVAVLSRIDVGPPGGKWFFDSQECKDEFIAALPPEQPPG